MLTLVLADWDVLWPLDKYAGELVVDKGGYQRALCVEGRMDGSKFCHFTPVNSILEPVIKTPSILSGRIYSLHTIQ